MNLENDVGPRYGTPTGRFKSMDGSWGPTTINFSWFPITTFQLSSRITKPRLSVQSLLLPTPLEDLRRKIVAPINSQVDVHPPSPLNEVGTLDRKGLSVTTLLLLQRDLARTQV